MNSYADAFLAGDTQSVHYFFKRTTIILATIGKVKEWINEIDFACCVKEQVASTSQVRSRSRNVLACGRFDQDMFFVQFLQRYNRILRLFIACNYCAEGVYRMGRNGTFHPAIECRVVAASRSDKRRSLALTQLLHNSGVRHLRDACLCRRFENQTWPSLGKAGYQPAFLKTEFLEHVAESFPTRSNRRGLDSILMMH